MKLAMISSVSAGNFPHVTLRYFIRGRQWLLDAEKSMPDVFRSMTAKNDMQLIQDTHYHLYVRYSKIGRDSRKSLTEQTLINIWKTKPLPIESLESSFRWNEVEGLENRLRGIPNPFDPHMNVE